MGGNWIGLATEQRQLDRPDEPAPQVLALDRTRRQQLAFGCQPIIEVGTIGAATFEEALVRPALDVIAGNRREPNVDGRRNH